MVNDRFMFNAVEHVTYKALLWLSMCAASTVGSINKDSTVHGEQPLSFKKDYSMIHRYRGQGDQAGFTHSTKICFEKIVRIG